MTLSLFKNGRGLILNFKGRFMSDLHISWDEYRAKTEELAKQIHKDGWNFNQVVCIPKAA